MPGPNGGFNGPLQVFAEGLLGFLQLKNAGRNPQELSQQVYGFLELRDWMFATRAQVATLGSQTLAAGNLGFRPFTTAPITVPNGEVWYVHQYSCYANLDNGETLHFRPAMGTPLTGPATTGIFGVGDAIQLSGAATPRVVSATAAAPFFLPPGHRLGIYVSICETAAAIEVEGTVRYTRLPI